MLNVSPASAMGAGASGGEAEWYNRRRLQEWVLCCCQDPRGGLKDKPDRPRDYYHTCYSLSGLSLSFRSTSPRHCQTDLLFNVRKDKLVGIADSG